MKELRIFKQIGKGVAKTFRDLRDVFKTPECPVDPIETKAIIDRELIARRCITMFLSNLGFNGFPIPSDEFFRKAMRKQPGWKDILAKAEKIEDNNQK